VQSVVELCTRFVEFCSVLSSFVELCTVVYMFDELIVLYIVCEVV